MNGNGHGRRREATLNLAIAPLVSKDQEQIGRLIIFDDVTDRAELEQRLVQADKLSSIGLLAAGVAHEVNTPLAVISTYAQMLAKQVADDSQKSMILDKIAKQTFRASEIVNSLLNFSRTSTTSFGDVKLEPRRPGDAVAVGAPASKIGDTGEDRPGSRTGPGARKGPLCAQSGHSPRAWRMGQIAKPDVCAVTFNVLYAPDVDRRVDLLQTTSGCGSVRHLQGPSPRPV